MVNPNLPPAPGMSAPQAQHTQLATPTVQQAAQAMADLPPDLLGGFTDADPSRAAIMALLYGQQKTSKTSNTVLAFDNPIVIYPNPTVLKPLAFMYRQIEMVKPGLARDLGIRDPRIPFEKGGMAKIYVQRDDAKRWIHQHPQFGAQAANNNYVGAFYMYARYHLFPVLAAQLAPGGLYDKLGITAAVIDESSIMMDWIFEDISMLGKVAAYRGLYGDQGRTLCAEKGSYSVWDAYRSVGDIFREMFFDVLYARSQKHIGVVAHETAPRFDRKTNEMNWTGGPRYPSGAGIEHFVSDATIYWRCLAVDQGAADRENRRIEASALALHNAQLAELEAQQEAARANGGTGGEETEEIKRTLQLMVRGSAKMKQRKAMAVELPEGSAFLDDLGWPTKLIRFMQTEEANDYAAGSREPFTPAFIPTDLRAALAFAGTVEARPRLRDTLDGDELKKLRQIGRMAIEQNKELPETPMPRSVVVPDTVTAESPGAGA